MAESRPSQSGLFYSDDDAQTWTRMLPGISLPPSPRPRLFATIMPEIDRGAVVRYRDAAMERLEGRSVAGEIELDEFERGVAGWLMRGESA